MRLREKEQTSRIPKSFASLERNLRWLSTPKSRLFSSSSSLLLGNDWVPSGLDWKLWMMGKHVWIGRETRRGDVLGYGFIHGQGGGHVFPSVLESMDSWNYCFVRKRVQVAVLTTSRERFSCGLFSIGFLLGHTPWWAGIHSWICLLHLLSHYSLSPLGKGKLRKGQLQSIPHPTMQHHDLACSLLVDRVLCIVL